MIKVELTQKEWDLIATIRNYKKGYPPSKDVEWYIETLLNELLDEDNE